MTNNSIQTNDMGFTEAPASWNVKYVTPDGFQAQLTLRAITGSELLEKSKSALEHLVESDCSPYYYGHNSNSHAAAKCSNGGQTDKIQNDDDPGWCSIHQCQMKRWEKEGRVWYSHKVNGEWCKGE